MAMKNVLATFGLTSLLLVGATAHGKPHPAPAAPADPAGAATPAPAEVHYNWEPGPKKISLGHDLELDLPADQVYLNADDAKKLLEKEGNIEGEGFLGMVVGKDPEASYWISLRFDDEGYIKDDEKIDADAILKSLREGQEEGNKERKDHGFPPLFIDGWSEAPHYDKVEHKLVWAIDVHSDRGKSVNFNTRVLGRKGFASVNLITSPDKLPQYKPAGQETLAATKFTNGSRYADFNSKTDKVATYGLVGLIGAGAGAVLLKGGLFAKLLVLLAKGAKLIALAFVGLWAWLKKTFTGKDSAPQSTKTAPPSMVDTQGNAPNEDAPAPHDAPSHDPGSDFK
jgi:uncharacterized membrane-anchored protein